MKQESINTAKPGITLDDIYYTVFKHKRKIVAFSVGGILAALLAYAFWPVTYRSEAQLFIKYVREAKSTPDMGDATLKSPDEHGETIINNELGILTSQDVARDVATTIRPEIQKQLGGEGNPALTAYIIRHGLDCEVRPNSSVIRVVFEHSNPAVVQPVLSMIVDAYKKKHVQIHRSMGLLDDFLTKETDQLRSRLMATEKQLQEMKKGAGVISVPESMKEYAERISLVRQQIFEAETDLSMVSDFGMQDSNVSAGETFESPLATNSSEETNLVASSEDLAEYLRINGLLDSLYEKERDYLLKNYTPKNPLVETVHAQINEYESKKTSLEKANPELAAMRIPGQKNGRPGDVALDPAMTLANARSLRAKIAMLKTHLAEISADAFALNEKAPAIADLERQVSGLETQYQSLAAQLEQIRIEDQLGPDRISNIGDMQSPTPPTKVSGELPKILLALVFGGFAMGLTLAFVIEFYLDQSLKRPIDVEHRLGLPLFLSIPNVNRNGKSRRLAKQKTALRIGDSTLSKSSSRPAERPDKSAATEIVPWALNSSLRSFLEALRDRLVFYFEIRNLTHKPKLVAVTSCREGAGASTVASGLAATLSETGDGNVLLVDMNMDRNVPYHFHKGDLRCGLDEVLNGEKKHDAMVQDNLYVASHASGDDKLARILPKRFTHLLPKLKASDYDFIIFDMPPVTQLSVTPQLSRYMDMVLMVVESEKTNFDVVKRASSRLAESKTNLGIVLNKTESYVPKRLQHEL